MTWALILHELLHFWLAFLGALLAWGLTWIIWQRVYSSERSHRPVIGLAASVAHSMSLLFWALLLFFSIGSHVLIDYW